MRNQLVCLIFCLGILSSSSSTLAQGDPASEVIWRVNALRAAYGLPAYQVNAALTSAAQAQASWSAANNHIGHDGPGGSSPNDRALAAGYGAGAKSHATENAAHGTASLNTPELVVTMWQSDAVHLKALVSPDYEDIGVGFAEAGGFSWYVLMVGWVEGETSADSGQSQATQESAIPYSPFSVSTPDEIGAVYHIVQPGQSAWTIAAYYGIDLAELLALNGLTNSTLLQPGEKLLVREGKPVTITPTATASASPTSTPTPSPPPSATPTPVQSAPAETPQPGENFTPPSPAFLITGIFLVAAGMVLGIRLASRKPAG